MATTKITQLPGIHSITANTSNTIFVAVDVTSGTTGKISANVVADGLYSYNPLKVGTDPIQLPNTIGQFTESSNSYIQVNLKNQNNHGTADYIVTANTGSDTSYYIDLGYTNNLYNTANAFNGLGTSIETLSGYLYVQGGDYATGNLVIGTTVGGTETRFLAGGINSQNVVAKITESGLRFVNNKGIIFSDGTQLTSNTPLATLSNNLNTANTWLQANDATTLTIAKSYTDTANNFIQSHYLANTTGTFSGNLSITGAVNITGNTNLNNTLHVHNSNLPGNTQYVTITGTANGAISTPTNPGYTLHTAVDTGNRIVSESYGVGSSVYAAFIGRRGRGTGESPSAVQNGDIILRVGGNGYGSSKFSQFSDARMEFVATETHTDTSKGTQIQFWTTSVGSNTATKIGTMNGDSVTFTGSVIPAKGFVFTPRVPDGNQTTITINYATDSIIKANLVADLSISHTNYVAGKVVEVWLVNNDNANHTVTHGCAALRSTNKSTTATITSGSSMYLRFFSIDGDNANTFVSIIG